MDIFSMRREINQAGNVLRNADSVANDIAQLLPGRLKHVDSYTLKKLKTELKNFNAHTGTWKDK